MVDVLTDAKSAWPKAEWDGDRKTAKMNVGAIWVIVDSYEEGRYSVNIALEDVNHETDVRQLMWTKHGSELSSMLDDAYRALLIWTGRLVDNVAKLQHLVEPDIFSLKKSWD